MLHAWVWLPSPGWTWRRQTEERLGYPGAWSGWQVGPWAGDQQEVVTSPICAHEVGGEGCPHETLEFSNILAEIRPVSLAWRFWIGILTFLTRVWKSYKVFWWRACSALQLRSVWIHLALLGIPPHFLGKGQHIYIKWNFLPYSAVPELLYHVKKFRKNFFSSSFFNDIKHNLLGKS